ncbi:ATP synthase subunit I [Marinomonas fungiae]|uniref:FoF1-type ATP synthase assembly protein I n=1 Tax=Marinomonas fungiae TaxID=1137284 RepID=A0A0K6IKN7_9GAMM|nr:ATP synthase subunit I [Marinomonas fungiae]CUB03663.1 FoF1-type ATP synthase assembly protein I [Marinomonas fungiae]
MAHSKPLKASALLAAKKRAVFRFIAIQLVLVFCLSAGIYVIYDGLYAYSFLAGALASVLPSFYMAWRVFGHAGTRAAKDVVKSFYRGEAGKLVLTAILLAAVFILLKPIAPGALFAGFGIAILSHWLSPLLLKY